MEITTITFSYTKDGTTVQDTHDIAVEKIPASLAISGTNNVNEGGNAVSLTATVTYTDATTSVVSLTDWASDDTGSATVGSSTGIVTSASSVVGDQVVNISGSYTEGSVTVNDSFAMTVNETTKLPVSAIIVGPSTVDEGTTASYLFRVTYDDASVVDETISSWSSDNTAGSINASTGLFTASADVANDTASQLSGSFTAAGTTVNATFNLTVIDTTNYPVSATILGSASLNEGDSATYQLEVTYTDTSTAVVPVTDWAVDNAGAGAIVPNTGVFTSVSDVPSDQTTNITASYTELGVTVNDSREITIVDTTLYPSSVLINGPTSVDEGTNGSFTATVTYSDSSTAIVTGSVNGAWSVDANGTIGANNGVLTASEVTGDKASVVSYSYTENGQTVNDTYNITIVDVVPASVAISGPPSVDEGSLPINFGAIVTYDNAGTSDKTSSGTWSINHNGGGTINSTTGEFTPASSFLDDQTVEVTFSYTEDGNTVIDTHTLTVVDKSLPTGATITGATTSKAGDAAFNLSASVTFDDATSGDKTTEGTWSNSNAAAGSINPSTGVFTPIAQ